MKKIEQAQKKQLRYPLIFLLIILAAFLNAFSVKVFMKPLKVIPVGITGTSVLIEQLSEKFFHFKFPYYYLYAILNLSLASWAWFFLSKSTVIKSLIYIIVFFVTSRFVPDINLTNDQTLRIISGGLFNGFSNVILLFIGGSTAGYNFIGLYLSKKAKKSLVGSVNLWTNSVMIVIAGLIFGYERAIMSFVTALINSFLIDRYHNQSKFVSLFIVTNKPNLFTSYATEKLHRSATIISSVGSYSQQKNTTLILTLTKHKLGSVKRDLKNIDPNCHITIYNVNQIVGNMKSQVGESAI